MRKVKRLSRVYFFICKEGQKVGKKYHLITQDERLLIEQRFNAGDPVYEIAREIGIHTSSLYREIHRGLDKRGQYCAKAAQAALDRPRKRWIRSA